MKTSIFSLLFALLSISAFAQKSEYQLSSHILDISKGLPASGVTIKLEKLNESNNHWTFIEEKVTDDKGRISDFLPSENDNNGIYKFTFLVEEYFERNESKSFYPFIEVVFQIEDDNHYHVPITLSAYGYSTYRGN